MLNLEWCWIHAKWSFDIVKCLCLFMEYESPVVCVKYMCI
jgi:hypothetical protein